MMRNIDTKITKVLFGLICVFGFVAAMASMVACWLTCISAIQFVVLLMIFSCLAYGAAIVVDRAEEVEKERIKNWQRRHD